MNMKLAFIILLVFAGMVRVRSAHAKDKPLKVFICAGQSNMVGKRSRLAELPEGLRGEQDNVFFNGVDWVPVAPGATEKRGYGPEIAFAQRIGALIREPVGIVKHSRGGTSLAHNWNPRREDGLYAALLAKVRAARKTREIEIVGMLWMQGEADARSAGAARNYGTNLLEFIRVARRDFDSPKMIFLSGRVNPPISVYSHVNLVRRAQEQCAAEAYGYIDCDGLPKVADQVHYNSEGIVKMGQVFAEAMHKRMVDADSIPGRGP